MCLIVLQLLLLLALLLDSQVHFDINMCSFQGNRAKDVQSLSDGMSEAVCAKYLLTGCLLTGYLLTQMLSGSSRRPDLVVGPWQVFGPWTVTSAVSQSVLWSAAVTRPSSWSLPCPPTAPRWG